MFAKIIPIYLVHIVNQKIHIFNIWLDLKRACKIVVLVISLTYIFVYRVIQHVRHA
jgi:hypothetical protein